MSKKTRKKPSTGEDNAVKDKPLFRQPDFKRWKWHFDNKRACNSRYRKKLRDITRAWKTECFICGVSGSESALEAHHLDPSQKESEVSQARTLRQLLRELAKCVPLCHDCHAELHRSSRLCSEVRKRAELIRSRQ